MFDGEKKDFGDWEMGLFYVFTGVCVPAPDGHISNHYTPYQRACRFVLSDFNQHETIPTLEP
jgi:hypothetical protein